MEAVVLGLRTTLVSLSSGTKKKFLDGFAPIHVKWHMAEMSPSGLGTFKGSPIGFLSFHHEVISVYRAKFAPGLTPGTMATTSPPYRPLVDSLTDPGQFSHGIEGWHGLVHLNAKKYGVAFGDPNKNIYMKRFWEFHEFIGEKFTAFIKRNKLNYDTLDHVTV